MVFSFRFVIPIPSAMLIHENAWKWNEIAPNATASNHDANGKNVGIVPFG